MYQTQIHPESNTSLNLHKKQQKWLRGCRIIVTSILAFTLSDKGYDVWMGNARGTIFSKKHESLSTSDPQFWNFR